MHAPLCFLQHYLQDHNMKATQVSVDKAINEMIDAYTHTHTETVDYYSAIKRIKS